MPGVGLGDLFVMDDLGDMDLDDWFSCPFWSFDHYHVKLP
jgi:hypothetical protein